jgi:hypothetical protein
MFPSPQAAPPMARLSGYRITNRKPAMPHNMLLPYSKKARDSDARQARGQNGRAIDSFRTANSYNSRTIIGLNITSPMVRLRFALSPSCGGAMIPLQVSA